jgi:hypothetical protein
MILIRSKPDIFAAFLVASSWSLLKEAGTVIMALLIIVVLPREDWEAYFSFVKIKAAICEGE